MSSCPYRDADGRLLVVSIVADAYFAGALLWTTLPLLRFHGNPLDVLHRAFGPHATTLWCLSPFLSPALFLLTPKSAGRTVRFGVSMVLCALWLYILTPNV